MSVEVSILCATYNQSEYLSDAIESFLMQNTTFDFEIIINDDASTDGTTEIALSYERRYPELIKVITHEKNEFSKGVAVFEANLLPRAQGRFLAFCEGDDYWISPHKLQAEYDALSNHPDCIFCVHASYNVDASSKSRLSINARYKSDRVVPVDDLILETHSFATNSYFVYREVYVNYADSPIARCSAHGDNKITVYMALTGSTYYLSEPMSAYRVLAKGSITSSYNDSISNGVRLELVSKRVNLFEVADAYSDGKYHKTFLKAEEKALYSYYMSSFYRDTTITSDALIVLRHHYHYSHRLAFHLIKKSIKRLFANKHRKRSST